MSDDLTIAQLQEQNKVLTTAFEHLLNNVEAKTEPLPATVAAIEAAGYEYDPQVPEWDYKVGLVYRGTITSDERAMTEDEARDQVIDRFWEDITELVTRGTFDEFRQALECVVGPTA